MPIFLQITVGWLYGHIFEYIAHKHVLHNRHKFKKVFRNHFKQHHKISRKNEMIDKNYRNIISSKFEVISLLTITLIHLPFLIFAPYFYAVVVWSVCVYYILHRISHVRTNLGKKIIPWHYAHHMGKNQHLNWGVRLPIIDMIMKTSKF